MHDGPDPALAPRLAWRVKPVRMAQPAIARPAAPVGGSRTTSAGGRYYTTRRRNTPGPEVRELFYSRHPWAGRLVVVHETFARGGTVFCRCSLSGSASDRWQQIPGWMFEPVAKVMWQAGSAPSVDIAALRLGGTFAVSGPGRRNPIANSRIERIIEPRRQESGR